MSVHGQLTAEIARQLAPQLRPRYVALMTKRLVMAEPESVAVAAPAGPEPVVLYPDIGVAAVGANTAGAAVAVAAAPLRLATVMPEAVPHFSVEIKDTARRRLVTSIEVLSPVNKRGGRGRNEYLAKRRRVLLSTAHLIEVDLLRQGQRVPMQQPLPPAAYFAIVSRFETRPMSDVWPIALNQSLPTVPVPLLGGDPDVPLDLQFALKSLYDLLGYDLAVDYTRPPEVPLRSEEAAWAGELLARRPLPGN